MRCSATIGRHFFMASLLLLTVRHLRRYIYAPPESTHNAAVDFGAPQCRYAVRSQDEALKRANEPSTQGITFTVDSWDFGDARSRSNMIKKSLALGYCCKSKMTVLPPVDEIITSRATGGRLLGTRWFDFSHAPDVAGFDSRKCKADIRWRGGQSFQLEQLQNPTHEYYNPALYRCIEEQPRRLQCEAAYLIPDGRECALSDDNDNDRATRTDGKRSDQKSQEPRQIQLRVQKLSGVEHEREPKRDERNSSVREEEPGQERAGHLVVHIRSGDVFRHRLAEQGFGQPPLLFYQKLFEDQPWDSIDVVTYSDIEEDVDPVVSAIQKRIKVGALPSGIRTHTNRTMGEDLQTIPCADALAMATSTLVFLSKFRSANLFVYVARQCSPLTKQRARKSTARALSWPGDYEFDEGMNGNPDQRVGTIAYGGAEAIVECT